MVNYGATPTVNPSAFMQLAAMNAMMANMLAAQTSLTPGAPPSYPPPAAAGAPFSFPAMPAVSPAPVNKPVLHPNGGALDTAAEKTAKKEQILAEKVAIEMANIRKIFRKQGREGAPTVNVYDPTFHYIYEVPTAAVTHLPPAKLNITRLVLCRSYHPSEPHRCLQQHLCKFVHVDCDLTTVPAQPIHVNYTYRALANCTYSRLPEGEVLEIPSESGKEEMTAMPSDHLLITRGSVWWYRKLHPEYTAVVDDKVFEVKTPETPAPSRRCVNYDHGCVCSDGHHCAYLHFITVDDTLSAPFRRKIQASAATYEEMNKPAEEEGEKDTAPPLEHVWLRAAKADVMGDSPEGTYFYLPPGGMTLTKVDKSAVVGEIPGAEESGGVSEASQQS
ncbi:hypothetical protein AGDE_15693 [Angomonas deanei]|uniref:C3H1-type domain-containing protein n=1 Tax=Angomonas deanei TaxID=59799 RepID=A0A7G2CR95_9TRYP|nr:hypothetical protein AGDE_15693 [Angomonas deanei]CAD2222336.1 hypothetical protein, conserved [Angomonas deanei]|eukprot:EPY18622.1 hypothetical protein AGDE_15693 [Angomonas deanei]